MQTAVIVLNALASEGAASEEHSKTSPYLYGLVTLTVLLLLLFIVTRFNSDR